MKIIGIVKNNCITGIEYGVIEIADFADFKEKHFEPKARKIKSKNKSSQKNTHLKSTNVEKGTQKAKKKNRVKYRLRATITLSYNYKPTKKPVDLTKKTLRKKNDLFKKKQRKEKIALRNLAQQLTNIEPISDFIKDAMNSIKQKNR